MPNFEYTPWEDPTNYVEPASKQKKFCYPVINGKVTLDFKGFEGVTIDTYKVLFIKDIDAEGYPCIAGVLHRKVCESIFKEATTLAAKHSRKQSVVMLLCIKKYVKLHGEVNGEVKTPYGLKYLDFGNPKKIEIPEPDIDYSDLDFDLN